MMIRRNALVSLGTWLAVVLLGPGSQALADSPDLVKVHCRGAESGGFVTPEVGDSLRDLMGAFEGKKDVLRLVERPEQADIVITIRGRGYKETGRRIYRSTRTRRHYRSTSTKETVKVLRASLQAGSYRLTLYGVDDLFWKTAAKGLANQVEKWVKGNYGQILAKRQNKDAAFSTADTDSDEDP